MTSNLQNSIFTDETKAREWLEARVWPQGRALPYDLNVNSATAHVGMWVISPERRCANSVNSGLWPKSITRSGLSPSP